MIRSKFGAVQNWLKRQQELSPDGIKKTYKTLEPVR
jgi:hypothetical protein